MEDNYITIPILEKFDQTKVIGSVRILKDRVPSTPDFVLSLGYTQNFNNDTFELLCVSMVPDKEYLAYLESNSDCIY